MFLLYSSYQIRSNYEAIKLKHSEFEALTAFECCNAEIIKPRKRESLKSCKLLPVTKNCLLLLLHSQLPFCFSRFSSCWSKCKIFPLFGKFVLMFTIYVCFLYDVTVVPSYVLIHEAIKRTYYLISTPYCVNWLSIWPGMFFQCVNLALELRDDQTQWHIPVHKMVNKIPIFTKNQAIRRQQLCPC